MCDTIVALGSATEEGFTLFGKNSDREPDEVQNILIVPRKKHNLNETVQCAYLTIPQVSEGSRNCSGITLSTFLDVWCRDGS